MNRELTIDNDIEFNILIQHLNRLIIAVRNCDDTVKCFAHGPRPRRVVSAAPKRAVHSGEHKRALCKNNLISVPIPLRYSARGHTQTRGKLETSTHEARHAPANAALPLSPLCLTVPLDIRTQHFRAAPLNGPRGSDACDPARLRTPSPPRRTTWPVGFARVGSGKLHDGWAQRALASRSCTMVTWPFSTTHFSLAISATKASFSETQTTAPLKSLRPLVSAATESLSR